METGGNSKAMDFFKKNGVLVTGAIDYKNPAILKYRQDLNKKVVKTLNIFIKEVNLGRKYLQNIASTRE